MDKDFAKLFENVARWVAAEYGVDEILKITADNFQSYLDKYHDAMALFIRRPEVKHALAVQVFNEINTGVMK